MDSGEGPTVPDPAGSGAKTAAWGDAVSVEAGLPAPRELLAEDLEIVAPIGRGGMARVYQARDLRLGRAVAVKMVSPEVTDLARWARAFSDEARAVARLSHPNVVTVFRAGEWQGRPFLVMELLAGETLSARPGPWPLHDAVDIGIQIAAALAAAHAVGILHRDLKASNVWLLPDGRVKVIDFGLARTLQADTQHGAAGTAGTPAVLAPEQWLGEEEDGRTDVWALGLLLRQGLVGQPARPAIEPMALRAEVTGGVPLPSVALLRPDLPPSLVSLVDRALRCDRTERPTAMEAQSLLLHARAELAGEAPLHGSPYRWLEPFGEAHQHDFHGRDREIVKLRGLLRDHPVVVLVGPSGAGKTSLVQAGLVPRLRKTEPWRVAIFRPGRRPLESLLRALPELDETPAELRQAPGRLGRSLRGLALRGNHHRLVVVDAAEELFTSSEAGGDAALLVSALRAAADDAAAPVRVLLTVREDFLSRLVALLDTEPGVGTALSVLPAPDRAALVAALEGPAERAGHRFEEGLAEAMAAAVSAEAAPLPLLQFAASRLWERRDEGARRLTRAALEELGGVPGILASHAEELIASLPGPEDIDHARVLLRGLLTPERTRRLVDRELLLRSQEDPERASSVLDTLIRGRLVVARRVDGVGYVELAHEALVHRWDRLAGWLDLDRNQQLLRERVSSVARHWDELGRPDDHLWRGEALDEARPLGRGGPDPVLRDFVRASEAQVLRAERQRRRVLGAVVCGALLLALAATGGMLAYRARSMEAEAARNEADARALALASSEAAQHSNEDSLRLAVEAVKTHASTESLGALRAAMAMPWVDRAMVGHTGLILDLQASPDGRWLVSTGADGKTRLWTLEGDLKATLSGHEGVSYRAIFTPSSDGVVTQGHDGSVRLWSLSGEDRVLWRAREGHVRSMAVASQAEVAVACSSDAWALLPLDGAAPQVRSGGADFVAVSPDGSRVAISRSGEIELWRHTPGAEGRVETRLQVQPPSVEVLFAPDGGSLYGFRRPDGSIERWSLDGRPLAPMRGHTGMVTWVSAAPGGRTHVSGAYDRTARLWLEDRSIALLAGHHGRIVSASFSPEGHFLVTGSDDSVALVWDYEGELLAGLRGHLGWAGSVVWAPNGQQIFTGGQDGTVRRWALDAVTLSRLADRREEVALGRYGPGDPVMPSQPADLQPQAVVSPSGGGLGWFYLPDLAVTRVLWTEDHARAITLSGDRYARLWDGATGQLLSTLSGGEGRILDGALHPRGDQLATSSTSGVSLWDLDGTALGELEVRDARRLLYSPEGALVVGFGDGSLRAYDAQREPLWIRSQEGSAVSALAWTSEGGLLSGGEDGRVRLWSAEGQLVATLPPHAGPVSELSAFGAGGYSIGGTTTQLFDAHGRILRTLDNGVPPIAALHSQRELLFVSGPSSELWTADGQLVATFVGHRGSLNTAAFSPDGTRLVTAGNIAPPQIWDLSGELLHTLHGVAPPTMAARFSPDGTSLVVASSSVTDSSRKPVQLWGADGTRREVLGHHPRPLLALGFSPDARRLLSWSDDAAVQVYELDPAVLLAQAEERLAEIPQVTPDLGEAGVYGSLY